MKVMALIPAFNEADRVGDVVRGAARYADEVLVVDDGSEDSTASEAEKAGAKVLRLPANIGYGGAVHTGYIYAADKDFDVLVQLDADGQHDPEDIPALIRPVAEDECDICLGSRFLGNSPWKPGLLRRAGMAFFSMLIRILTGRKITDPTTGFQAINRKAVARLASGAYPEDFPDADVLVMLLREKFRIGETGVNMNPPPPGKRMHSGLVPLYYIVKMTLSVLVIMIRRPE